MRHANSLMVPRLAALLLAALGMASLGVQPQLTQLFEAHGLTGTEAGILAALEIAAMALGSFAALNTRSGLRCWRVATAAGALLFGNLVPLVSAHFGFLIAARSIAGLGEGTLAAAGMAIVMTSTQPVRTSAFSIALTAVPQLLLGWAMPAMVSSRWGADTLFCALAALSLPTVALLFLAAPQPRSAAKADRTGPSAWVRLIALGLLCACGSACWTFMGALGAFMGLDGHAIAVMLACSLTAQIAAGLLLSIFAPARGVARLLALTILIEGASIAALTFSTGPALLILFAMTQGLTWQMSIPLGTGQVLARDRSPATAALILPICLFGVAVGPLAILVVGGDVVPLFRLTSLALLVAAAAMLIWRGRRGQA